jgi:hypothetical protein
MNARTKRFHEWQIRRDNKKKFLDQAKVKHIEESQFYCVSDYGYGDNGQTGPYGLFEAVEHYFNETNRQSDTPFKWQFCPSFGMTKTSQSFTF